MKLLHSPAAAGTPSRKDERLPVATPPVKRSNTAAMPVEEDDGESFVQRFVPDMVVERLFHGGAIQSQELSRYQEAVVGFFDVSGFSSLARDLEQADKTRSEKALKKRSASSFMAQHSSTGKGAEELVRQLNETLAVLIDTIQLAGGDIIKFAGDAILVVWMCVGEHTLEKQLLRASQCALECCALKSDQSKLGLHVGIGCGELVAAHVGGTFGRWEFFIAGDACTQSALAEHHAGINQVVLSPQAVGIAKQSKFVKSITMSEVEEGYNLLQSLVLTPLGPAMKSQYSLASDPNVAKAAEGYVPGPVRDALKSGGNTSASVGGLRKLTVIFFKLYDVNLPATFDPQTEKEFLAQCQTQAKLVQDSAYHYYATLRQFILDDKGFVAIVALGLPPFYHEDNAVRAVKVAKRLIEHHKIKASAGICTGTVFCGVVGSSKRAEYSVAGSCINLAARLMAKAPMGSIWCDATTKLEAESLGQIRFEQLPSLPFKGFATPVEIYGPMMNLLDTPPAKTASGYQEFDKAVSGVLGGLKKSPSSASNPLPLSRDESTASSKRKRNLHRENSKRSSVTVVGMEHEMAAVARAGFVGTSHNPVRVCFVEGDAGSGKTRLVEWVLKETVARRSILTSADSSETNTPFYVWRSILQSILSITSKSIGGSQNGKVLAGKPHSILDDVKEGARAGQSNRKRGFSSEDSSLLGPSHPPQPPSIHNRNLSAETHPFAPSQLRSVTSANSPVHRRSQSNPIAGEPSSPFRKKAPLQPRPSRGDSLFDAAVEHDSDSSEEETNDERDSRSNQDDEASGESKKRDRSGEDDDDHGEGADTPASLMYAAPPPANAGTAPLTSGRYPSDSISSIAGTSRSVHGSYVPDRSLVLESLHESGRLKGRRLSCLHAILPNLVIPPELETNALESGGLTASKSLGDLEISSKPSNLTSMLAAKLVTPQRKASLTGKSFFTSGGQNFGPIASNAGGSGVLTVSSAGAGDVAKQSELMSEAMASMELMALLIEECGLLGTLLIIIENAQYMDKQSWELLKRLSEMHPSSWKGEHRVRFIVTYRPFPAPREHPLQMILHGPMMSTGSFTSIASGSGILGIGVTSASLSNASPASTGLSLSASPPQETTSQNAGGTLKSATERVSSTLSAIAHHATIRRRSVEGTVIMSNRYSNSEVRSEAHTEAEIDRVEPQAIRVVINPLTLREAGVFLSNVHKIAIGPNLLQFTYKKARGNPRGVLELFKALQDQDLIKVDHTTGMVEETTNLDDICDMVFVIPLHLRAQLQQQLDRLHNREQLILKLASVVGSVFPLSLLKWLYTQRATAMPTSTTDDGYTDDAAAEQAALEADFQAGLKELREKGLIRPVFTRDHDDNNGDGNNNGSASANNTQRATSSEAEIARVSKSSGTQVESPVVGDDASDNWIFDSDTIRLIVYSQMLHTTRREIHGLVLDWYASRAKQLRLLEDAAYLGNHAIGAERPQIAFQAFKEGLRRVVFREEAVSRGERYWQSCADLLDDSATGFAANTVQAYKVVIDVLMGHVCVQNESWDEAKHYLNRALETHEKLAIILQVSSTSFHRSSSAIINFKGAAGGGWGCMSLGQQLSCVSGPSESSNNSLQGSGRDWGGDLNKSVLRDPLSETATDACADAKSYASLARSLLKRIDDLQQTQRRMVASLKEFSLKQTANRD